MQSEVHTNTHTHTHKHTAHTRKTITDTQTLTNTHSYAHLHTHTHTHTQTLAQTHTHTRLFESIFVDVAPQQTRDHLGITASTKLFLSHVVDHNFQEMITVEFIMTP